MTVLGAMAKGAANTAQQLTPTAVQEIVSAHVNQLAETLPVIAPMSDVSSGLANVIETASNMIPSDIIPQPDMTTGLVNILESASSMIPDNIGDTVHFEKVKNVIDSVTQHPVMEAAFDAVVTGANNIDVKKVQLEQLKMMVRIARRNRGPA